MPAFDALLATKLHPPPVRAHTLARPRLVERLDRSRRVVLVVAPAGFGKTSLVAAWAAARPRTLTWLSLDTDDSQPERFLLYLISAIQAARPEAGQAALALLHSTPLPPTQRVLTVLLNDLAASAEPLDLVLDDYQAIESQAVHAAVAYVLDHQPPTLRLIITSRGDPPLPLARLRARDQLTEIRAHDLRFAPDEAAAFLEHVMGLHLPPEAVATLAQRTEGWAAGLQLAGLSLQGRAEAAQFIAEFSGSHRHVISYLVEEVLNRQPQPVVGFLLQTSILDQLCAGLCAAVTQAHSEGASQALLENISTAGLFLLPLDEAGRWFRYHRLFADALQARLTAAQPELIPALHQRASAWLEGQGLLEEALRHALAGGDPEGAAGLVEAHAWRLLGGGEAIRLRSLVEALPGSVLARRPRLGVARAWTLATSGRLEAAEQALANVSPSNSPEWPIEARGGALALQALMARLRGDLASSLAAAKRALEILPSDQASLRAIAEGTLIVTHILRGDADSTTGLLQAAVRRGTAAAEPAVAGALVGLAWLQLLQGQLASAETTFRQALDLGAARPPTVETGMGWLGLGQALYERDTLEAAEEALQLGTRLLRGTVEQYFIAQGYGLLARLRLARHDPAGALAQLAEAEAWFRQMALDDLGGQMRLASERALIDLAVGKLDEAVQWAGAFATAVPEAAILLPQHSVYLAAARVWMAAGQFETARALLDRLLEAAEAGGQQANVLEALAARALAHQAQDRPAAALADLERALRLAAPEGFRRTFLDLGEPMRRLLAQAARETALPQPLKRFADQLRGAFPLPPSASPRPSAGLAESLTERELEILRLMAAGRTNPEIAAALVLAVGTVKKHTNNLFGKLGVSNRTQAAARARELGLL